MDVHAKKVWLPGAASFLLFLGCYFMLGPVPFDKMLSLPYLVFMPLVGAFGAYLSRRMKGSVTECIASALFTAFALRRCSTDVMRRKAGWTKPFGN